MRTNLALTDREPCCLLFAEETRIASRPQVLELMSLQRIV